MRRGPLMRVPPSGAGRFDLPIGPLSGRGKRSKKLRRMRGSGLLDTIKKVKDFVFGMSDKAKKAFQTAANLYRMTYMGPKKVRMLHLGELHPLFENYTGPGTRLDLKEVRDTPPFDEIDKCSEAHDYEYEDYFKIKDDAERRKKIRASDLKALRCYERYKNEPAYKYAHTGISSKVYLEDKFPFIAKKLLGVYFGSNK
jgi:hypothetical protein